MEMFHALLSRVSQLEEKVEKLTEENTSLRNDMTIFFAAVEGRVELIEDSNPKTIDQSDGSVVNHILEDPRFDRLPLKRAMPEMTVALATAYFGEDVLKVTVV